MMDSLEILDEAHGLRARVWINWAWLCESKTEVGTSREVLGGHE